MIYGRLQLHAVIDQTDLIGIRTLVLRQHWQPEGNVTSQQEIDRQKPGAPSMGASMMLMGEQTRRERGRYATFWTFQGVNEGAGVTFKDRTNSIDFGFSGGFAQVPVQVVKNFSKLLENFQGYPSNDGTTVIWPPTLAKAAEGEGENPLEKSEGVEDPGTNPMFGIQTAFEMEGVYRFRYAAKTLPPTLLSNVGFIATNLPGKPPEVREGRNWLMATPDYDRKGTIYDITEYYWLSRRGGWPQPLYRRGYFGGSAEGPTETEGIGLTNASPASL